MTREEIVDNAIKLSNSNKAILLEFSTGSGKTKTALSIMNNLGGKWLVAVAETAHKQTWKDEIRKHNLTELLKDIEFTCYASLHKYNKKIYKGFVGDEIHNCLSQKRLDAIKAVKCSSYVLLSATIEKKEKDLLERYIGSIKRFKFSLTDAIDAQILPKPKINLISIELDNISVNQELIITKGSKTKFSEISCKIQDRWTYLKAYKDVKLIIKCTEQEKYDYLCSQIDYYQKIYYGNGLEASKNRWLQYASQRKRFISEIKTRHVKKLIDGYKERFICFSGSIEQCNKLGGKSVIHSKIKDPQKIIDKFNNKQINQLYVVDMLREGVNLVEANAIIVQLDSKSRSAIQMVGRSLRHSNPVIHIFFVKNTQDEIYLKNSLEEFGDYVV